MATSKTPTDWIALARNCYERNIAAEHKMEILRDEGEYRHLRFRKPGTGFYRFDLVTWPGHIASTGDVADGYILSDLHGIDLLEFLSKPPDFNYWATKVQASRWPVKKYSEEIFHARVNELLNSEPSSERKRLKKAWEEHIRGHDLSDFYTAVTAAMDFNVDGVYPMAEFYEYDLKELDFHFVLACLCIQHGAREYLSSKSEVPATSKQSST